MSVVIESPLPTPFQHRVNKVIMVSPQDRVPFAEGEHMTLPPDYRADSPPPTYEEATALLSSQALRHELSTVSEFLASC